MTQSVMYRSASPKAPAKPREKQQDKAQDKKADQKQDPKFSAKPANTPSDVVANAASEAKQDNGVYASFKHAMSPYVEKHSHAVLYGIIGFIAAALILIVGFWPTVLLAVFAAVGATIGKYRDGDRKTRAQMKQLIDRFQ